MICKVNELAENTLEIVLPNGTDNAFKNVRRISVRKSGSNLAKFFPEEAFGAKAWISVKDKLPEMTEEVTEVDGDREYTLWYESKPVLVFDETVYDETSRMQTAVLTDDGDWLTTFDEKRLENVTHWMPLPDEPKDNA